MLNIGPRGVRPDIEPGTAISPVARILDRTAVADMSAKPFSESGGGSRPFGTHTVDKNDMDGTLLRTSDQCA
jgi:hypothetical protein